MSIFGNNQENISKSGQSSQTNLFCEGTVIEGEIKSANDIRLDGSINGNITSSAKIVIGQKGKVEGELKCQNGDISGFIRGKIEADEILFLKSTAEIEGDIVANKLVVEAGARFNGSCRMGDRSYPMMQNDQSEDAFKKEAI